jgi:glyoxylase-like metal-dependent hydrolase (beta-lactamase superfamily II)
MEVNRFGNASIACSVCCVYAMTQRRYGRDEHAANLYLKQIEVGQMANYVYLIGSTKTREVAVVDPAWEIDRIVELAQADEMRITHILATHAHPDHVGGELYGLQIQGIAELLERVDAVVVHRAEAGHLTRSPDRYHAGRSWRYPEP